MNKVVIKTIDKIQYSRRAVEELVQAKDYDGIRDTQLNTIRKGYFLACIRSVRIVFLRNDAIPQIWRHFEENSKVPVANGYEFNDWVDTYGDEVQKSLSSTMFVYGIKYMSTHLYEEMYKEYRKRYTLDSDWRLPTITEFKLMFNLDTGFIPKGFVNRTYWSSTIVPFKSVDNFCYFNVHSRLVDYSLGGKRKVRFVREKGDKIQLSPTLAKEYLREEAIELAKHYQCEDFKHLTLCLSDITPSKK